MNQPTKSPEDPAFRRGLFAMLVAIGLLVAGSFFYARDASADAEAARLDRDRLSAQFEVLLENQRLLLAENEANEARTRRFERLLGAFLASSSDPVIADALADLGVAPRPVTPDDMREPVQPEPKPGPSPVQVVPQPKPTTVDTLPPAPRPTTPAPRPTTPPPVAVPPSTPRPPLLPVLPTRLPELPCTSIVCVQP